MIINDKIGSRKTTNMDISIYTGWGPSSLAKLVQITIITTVYDTQIAIFRWGYKQKKHNWGALDVEGLKETNLKLRSTPTLSFFTPSSFSRKKTHMQSFGASVSGNRFHWLM